MSRTNLHDLANRLLACLTEESSDGTFEGRLREVAGKAQLNSVRSAEAIKLLEDTERIDVVQRGRRGRDTIIKIRSKDPLTLGDVQQMRPRAPRRARINYEDIGRSVVDRLLELARDDALRAAQVDAFEAEARAGSAKASELQEELDAALEREADLRVKLRAAEEALERSEENLRKLLGGARPGQAPAAAAPVPDEDARAVLDILRSNT